MNAVIIGPLPYREAFQHRRKILDPLPSDVINGQPLVTNLTSLDGIFQLKKDDGEVASMFFGKIATFYGANVIIDPANISLKVST